VSRAPWGAVPWQGPVLAVAVQGVPRPQPRPRFVGKGRGPVSTMEGTPAMRWKRLVLAAIAEAIEDAGWSCIPSGAVRLRLLVMFPTKRAAMWGRPRVAVRNADFDNVAKLVADALTTRKVFGDDGQVAIVEQAHVWVPPERAGVFLEVGAIDGYEPVVDLGQDPAPSWLGA
jgi:Holliday junction resolvase RusA-like endonuclease